MQFAVRSFRPNAACRLQPYASFFFSLVVVVGRAGSYRCSLVKGAAGLLVPCRVSPLLVFLLSDLELVLSVLASLIVPFSFFYCFRRGHRVTLLLHCTYRRYIEMVF